MKTSRTSLLIGIVLNLVIVLSTLWAVGVYFINDADALGLSGTQCFRYFTTDSNVLAMLVSLLMLVYLLRSFFRGAEIPEWVLILKFVGTVAVTLTFLTVVFFLIPTSHGNPMNFFAGNTFVLHFSTPVLCVLSLLLFERTPALPFRAVLFALLPTVVYSFVYAAMIFTKRWPDFYGFTFGGNLKIAPVSMIAMYAFTFLIAWAERTVRKALLREIAAKE